MKILITGASGFIGTHLTSHLLENNHTIRILIRETSSTAYLPVSRCDVSIGNLQDTESLKNAVADVDAIVHLAGSIIARDEESFFKSNRDGTKNLLSAIRVTNSQLKKFVYISSQAAAGPSISDKPITENQEPKPVSAYGRSKLAAEKEVLKSSAEINSVILRPSIVYGPRDKGFLNIIKMVKNHIRGKIGFGTTWMSIIHVEDLSKLITLAIEKSIKSGEIFFATDNRDGYPHDEVYDCISKSLGVFTIPVTIPKIVLFISAFLSQSVSTLLNKPSFLNMDKYREISQRNWRCSSEKARKLLGFNSEISLEEGIDSTIKWYRENDWI